MSSVTFSIQSHVDAIRWACLAVRGILEGVDLDDEAKYYVELAVSEAATNSLKHAYGGRSGHVIDLQVTVEDKQLIVEISDTGLSLAPERLEKASLPPDDAPKDDSGGRGLFLIRQTMDEVRMERVGGRNSLIMIKNHGGKK